ncbi:MAG: hypothetical protein ACXAAP_14820 [Candidatus Thorarchaeota archaeon]|jgi:hypothetical protein
MPTKGYIMSVIHESTVDLIKTIIRPEDVDKFLENCETIVLQTIMERKAGRVNAQALMVVRPNQHQGTEVPNDILIGYRGIQKARSN